MEGVDNSHHDHHHAAAAAFSVKLEVELVGERNNGAAAARTTVLEQEEPEPRTEGRRRPGRARRLDRRLHPATVARACWRWLKHPAHVALVAWALCVAASGSMLGLLLIGSLNGAFPRRSIRNRWIEINNQVLNALFTLMSIYQHPALFHHAVLLLRWRPGDAKVLREAYCRKGAGSRRGERVHMSVVAALLHAACFAQYAMCGLYWGYSRRARPDAALTSLTVVGTATPVIAGLYMYFGPLGRKHGGRRSVHQDPDERSAASDEDNGGIEVAAGADWAGGLLDVGDDPTACWLSCLCTFCVLGWNLERLGFGNAHVHTVMFALLCFAPLWVLSAAELSIRYDDVAFAVGVTGVVLCALGLLYGGFWRARMRRRYGLPATNAASPSLADYGQWIFCWGCALAQEVRTADNLLDVEAGSVSRPDSHGQRQRVDADAQTLQPLPRECGVKSFHCNLAKSATIDTRTVQVSSYSTSSRDDESPLLQHDQGSSASSSREMTPPVPPSISEGEHRQFSDYRVYRLQSRRPSLFLSTYN